MPNQPPAGMARTFVSRQTTARRAGLNLKWLNQQQQVKWQENCVKPTTTIALRGIPFSEAVMLKLIL
jgi:hypothetical protein